MTKIIDLAAEFSTTPFGRFRGDGEFSAEHFRDDLLIPALRTNPVVVVDLSGSNLYGSSFLEEAFGGLLRHGFTQDQLSGKLQVKHKLLPSIEEEIKFYIDRAD